ncbi:oligosaccharide flippase family protein [Vibrio splendidus]
MIKSSLIYVLGNIINSALPLLLLPFLTRVLSPSEFGLIAIFQVCITMTTLFIGINASSYSSRSYFDRVDHTQCNNNILFIFLFLLMCFLICLILWGDWFSYLLGLKVSWLYICILSGTFTLFYQLVLVQFQVRGQINRYVFLQTINVIFQLTVTIYIVSEVSSTADGRVWSIFLSTILVGLISLYIAQYDRYIDFSRFKVDFSILKDIVKFGAPLLPHAIGVFIIANVDRIIIKEYLGDDSVGIYMAAFQIGLGVNLIINSLNKAYVPYLYEILDRNQYEEKLLLARNSIVAVFLLLILAIFLLFLGPYLTGLFLGDEYNSSSDLVGILIFANTINGIYLIYANYIFFSKKVVYLSYITISTGMLSVFLSILLVDHFGLLGVAYSYLFSMLLKTILTSLVARRLIPMPNFIL